MDSLVKLLRSVGGPLTEMFRIVARTRHTEPGFSNNIVLVSSAYRLGLGGPQEMTMVTIVSGGMGREIHRVRILQVIENTERAVHEAVPEASRSLPTRGSSTDKRLGAAADCPYLR